MNLKNRIILEDFRKTREDYLELERVVVDQLHEIASKNDFEILGIEHRVKTEKSLAGKLERKGDSYQTIHDLTDLLGTRIICYFNDQVDIFSKEIEQTFAILWEHSMNKKDLLSADRFGYLSVHYICYLTEEMGYPANICNKYFEIQIRTNLQHTWSAINHDLGYKSEFGVPKVITRDFARLAGLLELADNEFARIRDRMNAYTEETREKIKNNTADDVPIDMISLEEYMLHNIKMREFLNTLASYSGAEIQEINPESYIEQLAWLGKKTLGDLQTMLEEDRPIALELAERVLTRSELDILSSTVGLRYLCRAELFQQKMNEEQLTKFFQLSTSSNEQAVKQAKYTLHTFEKLSISGNPHE